MKPKVKAIAFIVILVVLFWIGAASGLADKVMGLASSAPLKAWASANPLPAGLAYVIGCAAGSVVLALPGFVFALLAGYLFGPWAGTVLAVMAATLGALGAFLAGRFFLADSIRPKVMGNPTLDRWLFSGSRVHAVTLLAVTRLVPLFPFNLQNFAYGITDISPLTYTAWTAVFLIPGTAMYTFATAGAFDPTNRLPYLLVAFTLLAIVLVAGAILRKRYHLGD